MAASDQQVEALVAAYAASRAGIVEQILAMVRDIVAGFDGWYSTPQIALMARTVVARVEAGQRQVAGVTDAYLSRTATIIADRRYAPVGAVDVSVVRNVDRLEEFGRAADQYRYAVSQGASDEQAVAKAVERATAQAEMDTALTVREQSRKFMVVRSVDGWRRIIHPELSRGGSCGLCVAASDRTYKRGDLLALHERCNCATLPIINGVDPGKSLNESDIAALYKTAGSTGAADLKKVRYVVHEHGELGPVLRNRSDDFRSPDDVKSDETHAA